MADKRMIAKTITDRMRHLSAGAVKAYLFINLEADDDGVCQDVDLATYKTGCEQADIDELVNMGFVIQFPANPNRVIITHWWVNNNIPQSRRKKCGNEDFLELLELKGETYFLKEEPIRPRIEGKIVNQKPEPEPEPAATKEPEPEKVLVNEEKKRKGTPAQTAWKEFAEWTRRYPAIKQDDTDGRAAMTQYMRMYQQSPDSYKKLIALLKQAVETEVKTGREGITLTEIVERVRGDTG